MRIVMAMGFLCLTAMATAEDWNQWLGAARRGASEGPGLLTELPAEGLPALWVVKDIPGGNSGGWGSPVIADGRVYVFVHTKSKNSDVDLGPVKYPWLSPEKRTMSDAEYEAYEVKRRDEAERRAKAFRFDQKMVCVDLKSGALLWEHTQPSVYTRFVHSGTPCVHNGRVLMLCGGRKACCWDADNGKLLWETRLPGEFRDEYFCSSFAASGNVGVVACGALFALNLQDGSILWQGDDPVTYGSHSSPVIWQSGDAAVVVANVQGGRTLGRRLGDGQLLWELQSGTRQSSPIAINNTLLTYGSSRKSGLIAFRLDPDAVEKTPEELWRFRRSADGGCTPAATDRAVFVQGERRMAKVDLETGRREWMERLPISSPRYTSPIVHGDQLLFGWQGLLAIDAAGDDFQLLYDGRISAEGRLFEREVLRRRLGLDEAGSDADSLAKAERTWQREAIRTGTLDCSTPAASEGIVVVRRRDSLAAYRLAAGGTAAKP